MKVIGASSIGHECSLYVWLTHLNVDMLTDPTSAIVFAEGKRLEEEVIARLRREGMPLITTDPTTGTQIWVAPNDLPQVGGYLDGCVKSGGENYAVEIKSASGKNYAKIRARGVGAIYPKYKSQLNCYIQWGGFDFGMWVVVNKDTGDLYRERLTLDKHLYQTDMARARQMIQDDMANDRYRTPVLQARSENPTCRFCGVRHICMNRAVPKPDCRQCMHARIGTDGKWRCVRGMLNIYSDTVCDNFVYRKALLSLAGYRVAGDVMEEGEYIGYSVRDHAGDWQKVCSLSDCRKL